MIAAVPMTTNTDRAILSHTLVLEPTNENGLTEYSVALVFHVRSLDKSRFKRKLGELTKEQMNAIDEMITELLELKQK